MAVFAAAARKTTSSPGERPYPAGRSVLDKTPQSALQRGPSPWPPTPGAPQSLSVPISAPSLLSAPEDQEGRGGCSDDSVNERTNE